MDTWVIAKVLCSDGVVRVGIEMECDFDGVAILRGLHYEYACGVVGIRAKMEGLEEFDNGEGYWPIEIGVK